MRFGTPTAFLSDNGTHFCNKPPESIFKEYVSFLKCCYTLPQTCGQVEFSNQELKSIFDKNGLERIGR